MVGISGQIYDLNGARIFTTTTKADAANKKGSRRVSITATLDGGVSIYDSGFSESDRTVIVEVLQATTEDVAFAGYICRTYNLIVIAMEDGVFEGVPKSYRMDKGTLEMTIRITAKISE